VRRDGLLVAVSGAVAAVALSVPAGAVSPSGATALYHRAIAAMRAESSVRIVTLAVGINRRVQGVTDAGLAEGTQRYVDTVGSSTGTVRVEIVAHTAYVKGTTFALEEFMGYKSAAARRYAGRWIEVPRSSPDYAPIAAGQTLSSAVTETAMAGALRLLAKTTKDGVSVVPIAGTFTSGAVSGTETLFVRATGAPLPVEEDFTVNGMTSTAKYRDWNEAVVITAPRGAVPIGSTGLL
jgi:hypothetical protein